jgi:hypothetical protein
MGMVAIRRRRTMITLVRFTGGRVAVVFARMLIATVDGEADLRTADR